MADKTTRRYSGGGGFFSARPRHQAPANCITSDSLDWMVSAVDEKLFRRKGVNQLPIGGASNTALLTGNAPSAVNCVTGISGAATDRRGRGRITELRSAAKTAGADPTFYHLFVDEVRGWGTVFFAEDPLAATPYGPIPFAQATNKVWGIDAGATLSVYKIHAYPVPYTCGGRGILNADRWQLCAGGRGSIQVNGWLALANLNSVPAKWNQQWPTFSATSIERSLPLGHIPPMWPPTITKVGAGTGSWATNSKFYLTVVFEWEDGSWSTQTQYRAPAAGSILGAAGLCYFDLGAGGPWTTLTIDNVPIGPQGVRRRHLCRSTVVTLGVPDPNTIGLWETLDDNTATSLSSSFGMDQSISPVPELLRDDFMLAPRHRYLWAFDQRIACGYTKPNPAAIFIAPWETDGGTGYHNKSESESFTNSVTTDNVLGSCTYAYFIRKTGSTLEFYLWDGALAGVLARDVLTLTGLTLQDVVDHINARSLTSTWGGGVAPWAPSGGGYSAWPAGTGFKFFAQPAPGWDGSALATELQDTTSTNTFGDTFRMNKPAAATTHTLQRTYGPSWPGLLVMGTSWMGRYPASKRRVNFTGGGPGHVANAVNNWYIENFRDALDETGDIVGGAGLLDGCLVFGTTGISVLRNINNGKTGLDEDYRLEMLAGAAGCISPDSICQVNGAAVYLSREGLMVTDGSRFENLSSRIYDPGEGVGEWAYEIAQCSIAMQQDDDDYVFGVTSIESKLFVWYRNNGGVRRVMVYDYSSSPAKSGIEQFLGRDGLPLPWSCPLTTALSTIGAYRTAAGGTNIIGLFEGVDGEYRRLQEPGSIQDLGVTPVAPVAFFATDYADTAKKKSPQNAVVRYNKPATGMTVSVAKNLGAHATPSYFSARALPASIAGEPFKRKYLLLQQAARAPGDIIEFKVTDDGTGSTAEFWDIEVEVDILDSLY